MTEFVQAEVLGTTVEGRVVDDRVTAGFATGPIREFVVDVDGAGRYGVPASAVEPVPR